MTPSHVPTDHVPLQGQSIYNDPSYEHLFPRVNQYGGASWDQFNPAHSSLLPQGSGTQSWHQNSVPQQPYSQVSPYGNTNTTFQSPSPYNQFAQFNNRGPMSNYGRQSNIDPSLGAESTALRQQQQSPYQQAMRTVTPNGQPTITPQALQQNGSSLPAARATASPYQIPKSTTEIFAQRANPTPTQVSAPVSNPVYDMPKGKVSGGGISLIEQASLTEATKSTTLNKLVNFGADPFHLASNRTAMPMYTPRQSLKDMKKAGSSNRKILDKLSKKPSQRKMLLHKGAGTSRFTPGSPSILQREVTESDSYSDSSDDSEYTDDEDDEPSPLPTSRPDEPHAAVRYDVIKATWYPSRSSPSSEKIKESLRDLWEVLNTIQKRWRADSKAVTEAEEQKKKGELPVLKSRVTSQRDLLESALKSALQFGHPDVLYHLGQVKAFLYLCYQFLANRFKMQDYDGGLPSVIYEVLVRSVGTLTTELIDETKLIKALNSMKKNANEKNKVLIQQIVDGAAAGSKKPKVSPPRDEAPEQKNGKRPAPQPVGRAPAEGNAAKKPKMAEPIMAPARKVNPPSAQGSKAGTNTSPVPLKRPGERSAIPSVKSRVNQVVNKPSTFFSALSAATKKPTPATTPAASKATAPQKATAPAAKDKKSTSAAPAKPAFSFADTMAELLGPKEQPAAPVKPEKQHPPETPEEKAKRLRKESRRHLRVSFRPDANLVSIKYFHHDPEEEIRHDENFVRDAGDIGGEGRMFKQHRELEEDDDDDELETDYRAWKDPTDVDFTVVLADERSRNFAPYGGGERQPECPEKEANERREKNTLIVFYSDRHQIPPSPREPLEPLDQGPAREPRVFGEPPAIVIERSPKAPAPAIDLSNLESIFNQFATNNSNTAQMTATPTPFTQPVQAPQAAAPPVTTDLSAILKNLQAQAQSNQPAPVPAPVSAPMPTPPQGTQALPNFNLPPDVLASIMSAMQAPNGGIAPPPPLPAAWPQFPTSFSLPQQQGPAYQQQQPQGQYDQQQSSGGSKRQREDGPSSNNSSSNNERGYAAHKKQKNKHGDGKFRVIPCKFYQQGKCTKGADCTFIHDQNM